MIIKGDVMSLYSVYDVCSALFPMIPAHIVALFCIANNLSIISFFTKRNQSKSFLEIFDDMYGLYRLSKFAFVIVFICAVIVILFSNSYFVTLLGSKDLRTMPSGTYCYYVEATSEHDKTYTLPAKVEKINSNYYQVHNVYFKNGGYLYFEDSEYIKYKTTDYAHDQNGKSWDIKLTNKKTSHSMIEETKPKFIKNLWLPFIEMFSIVFTGTMTILYSIKHKKVINYETTNCNISS